MFSRFLARAGRPPFAAATSGALGLLLTGAAVWLYAHEGHQALPSKGARLDPKDRNRLFVDAVARAALGVQTAEVVQRGLDERLLAPAVVVAPWQRAAFATSRLGGRVAVAQVQVGQSVTEGQVLGEVQSLELESLYLAFLDARNTARLTGDTLADLKT